MSRGVSKGQQWLVGGVAVAIWQQGNKAVKRPVTYEHARGASAG